MHIKNYEPVYKKSPVNSLTGLVDIPYAFGFVDSVFHLPDEHMKLLGNFLRKFRLQNTVKPGFHCDTSTSISIMVLGHPQHKHAHSHAQSE